MARRALQDPPDQLVPLEREESRDSRVLMVSRVFLVPQVHLVREASQETWVFLEKLELLVPPGPEESEDSPEREVQLGLRACKDPEVYLELLERTGPREALGRVVELELRAPLVCKACLEREEALEYLDPRVTGAMWERKVLKGPLEKTGLEVSQVPLVLLVLLGPTVKRVNLVLLVLLELLEPVVPLETEARLDLLGRLDLLDPLVLTVNLELKESKEREDKRVTLVPLDPRDRLVPLVLLVQQELLDLKALEALKDPLVLLVFLELQDELDLLALMVTLAPRVPRVLLVKTDQRE